MKKLAEGFPCFIAVDLFRYSGGYGVYTLSYMVHAVSMVTIEVALVALKLKLEVKMSATKLPTMKT